MFLGISPSALTRPKMVGEASAPAVPTDPYFANVVSLLHFDTGNTTITDVIAGKTWTAVGNASANGTAKFGAYALTCDGAGDYISTTNSSIRGTTKTYEFWVYRTGTSSPTIFGSFGTSWSWSSTNGIELWCSTDHATNRLAVTWQVGGTYSQIFSRNNAFTADTWHHVAVVINNSGTEKIQLFINGVLEATSTTGLTQISSWDHFYIGADNTGNSLNGRVDDFRATDIARYIGVNVGDTVFSVPTAAFPDA